VNLEVHGRKAFAYTAAHEFDAARPAVVFVHGAGLDHSWFGLQSRYFGYHGWNVLAVDLPGHGRSEGPAVPSIQAMAQWVFTLLDLFKIQKTCIVGHSMGALIALECAAREPARVERIALIGVAYPMKVTEAFLDAARRNDPAAFDMETIWGHAPQVPLGGNPNPGMWMYGDTLARLRRLAPGVLHNDLKACDECVLELEKVACPALLVLGERDVMTPPKATEISLKRISDVKAIKVKTSGHSLMAEAPDATLDALIAFFSEKTSGR
jgi:pimeloyl-ACP methyl ester carboxylesterase